MRHRRLGRHLGRSSSHRRAMLKNLASSLFLTEGDDSYVDNAPKVKGRVVTTIHKAKEVRPLVEKCITLAKKSLEHSRTAEEFETDAERGTDAWKKWRTSDEWQKWCAARAPVVAARRRALQMLGNKEAVAILFDEVAPRFEDRPGGYTRVLRLASPRLGDAGVQAILEFVGGDRDRKTKQSERPAFGGDSEETADDVTSSEVDDAAIDVAAGSDGAATEGADAKDES